MNSERSIMTPPLTATGFKFSKIVIIESLDEQDLKTGELLKSSLDTYIQQANGNTPVEFVTCLTNKDIFRTLERLIYEAEAEGQIPVVHFECHGNAELGLFCTDDTVVGWPELGACLTRLNVATGLNLLVVFVACYGGYFLKTLSPLDSCPCWAMVGPTANIDPADAMGGFRSFYRVALTHRDIGLASAALRAHSLSKGRWLSQHCETWFDLVVKNYVVKLCNKQAVRQRTKNMYRVSMAQGKRQSIGFFKRQLKKLNRQNLSGELFDAYFMVNKIPTNRVRFAEVRIRLKKQLENLRATGLYAV